MSFQRLRTDFQFAIFVFFCVVAILGISPFAAYRFMEGRIVAGVVDTLIVGILAAGLLHVWRGGDLGRASLLIVIANTVGCIAVGQLLGLSGALWSYAVVLSNFLLVSRSRALAASALAIGLLVIDGSPFGSPAQRLMYLASASVTCMIAWVFAHQTHVQRLMLEAQASRDPLTGSGNRRAMDQELHIAAQAFERHRIPASLAVLDLDHFKHINDRAGHEAGDQVLVEFSRLVQSRCRAGDRLFRYGGEEFVLLLPGTRREHLRRLVEELRHEVSLRLRAGGGAVTVSIGAAVLEPGEDVQAWLARADAAMYEAKRLGRDRAVVAPITTAVAPA